MKRLLLSLIIALWPIFAEANPIPVTGTISLPSGARLNGRVRMTLSYSAARDTTNNNLIVAQVTEWPVSNGSLPASAQIVPNDVLQPGNTYYTAEYFNSLGSRLGVNTYRVTGASFNLGQAVPTPVTTSNLSFTDLTGITNIDAKEINNRRMCDQFPGATAGAKIAACIADLPSNGGIADANGFTGATNVISQNMFAGITKSVRLELGAARFQVSVAQALPASAQIVGRGKGLTYIEIIGAGVSAFTHTSDLSRDVTRVYIGELTILGPGSTSTAGCIVYDEAYENTIERVNISGCNYGVYWKDSGLISASSFTNTIIDSIINSADGAQAINLYMESGAGNTNLYNVTFGGGPSKVGARILDSSGVHFYGGDCEGTEYNCIQYDNDNGLLYSGLTVDGVDFEFNKGTTAGCPYASVNLPAVACGPEIVVGATNTMNAIIIRNNTFSGGAGAKYPLRLVQASNVVLEGNIVTGGYATSSNPLYNTILNLAENGNRWDLSTGLFSKFLGQSVLVAAGTGNLVAPMSTFEVRGTTGSGITSSIVSSAINGDNRIGFGQQNASGTDKKFCYLRGYMTDVTAGSEDGRTTVQCLVNNVDTELARMDGASGVNFFVNTTTSATLQGATVTSSGASATSIENARLRMHGNVVLSDGTPTCSGAGCAIVTGSINSSGKVTTTTTGAATIVVTFSAGFNLAPSCWVTNETTANLARAVGTTTDVTLSGVTASGDTLAWGCLGH